MFYAMFSAGIPVILWRFAGIASGREARCEASRHCRVPGANARVKVRGAFCKRPRRALRARIGNSLPIHWRVQVVAISLHRSQTRGFDPKLWPGMVVLNFTLNEEGVAVLHDVLACILKFSDDVCLEAKKDKV